MRDRERERKMFFISCWFIPKCLQQAGWMFFKQTFFGLGSLGFRKQSGVLEIRDL